MLTHIHNNRCFLLLWNYKCTTNAKECGFNIIGRCTVAVKGTLYSDIFPCQFKVVFSIQPCSHLYNFLSFVHILHFQANLWFQRLCPFIILCVYSTKGTEIKWYGIQSRWLNCVTSCTLTFVPILSHVRGVIRCPYKTITLVLIQLWLSVTFWTVPRTVSKHNKMCHTYNI